MRGLARGHNQRAIRCGASLPPLSSTPRPITSIWTRRFAASLKSVIGWMEFYGAPDEVCEDFTVRERYVDVRMAGDHGVVYMISDEKVDRLRLDGQGLRERLWVDDFTSDL